MKLLITGASGHIGQEIVRQAVRLGYDVVAVSRSGTLPDDADEDCSKAIWGSFDLTDAEAVLRLTSAHDIDACIHGAAVSNEAYARPDPLGAIRANVAATAHLLDTARVRSWHRFVLVSTGSVFQCRRDVTTPIVEDEPPAPQNIYSTTKVAAEMLARMYRSEYEISAVSARISWVYGPPLIADAPTRGPIPSYLVRSLRGETIDEAGGDFAASFTFVQDVAAGLLALVTAPRLNHDVYHLGPGRNFTVQEVADAVCAAVPTASIMLAPGTDPWTTFTAMRAPLVGTRLKDDTGFEPRYSLEAGINEYARWMRDNL